MKTIYWLKLLFLLLSFEAYSGTNPKIKLSYFIDSNSNCTIESIKPQKFKASRIGDDINIGYNQNATVWCKLEIQNTGGEKSIYIDFSNIQLDSVQMFDKTRSQLFGDRTTTKSLFHNAYTFQLKVNGNESKIVYFKVKKITSFLNFSLKISELSMMSANSFFSIFFIAILIGIGLILLLFNILIYAFTKNRINFNYIIYSFTSIFYVLITTGFFKHFIAPNFIYLSESRIYLGSLWFIILSSFITELLSLKTQKNNHYKIVKILNNINLALIFTSFIFLISNSNYILKLFFTSAYLNFAITLVVLFVVTIKNFKNQKSIVSYILLAFLPNFVWIIMLILKAFKLITNEPTLNWLIYLNIYEISLFGFILIKKHLSALQNNRELIFQMNYDKEEKKELISNIQIRERQQISNLIHDKFGSQLAHISNLVSLKKEGLILRNIEELASDIRSLSHQIMPKSLENGALLQSIKTHIENIQSANEHLNIDLEAYDFPAEITEKWLLDIYLISIEIVHNAIKHGNADEIHLEFYSYQNEYTFQFTDNGKGFDVMYFKKGFGITNIERRIQNHGGSFEINSTINEGTIVQINIPKN